ncbi:hypothetical protein [Streptomyces sp. MB09-02B]|uniref:hypothetical protein n=1 Tax=Streptomyces sp. MB09-02B TaxID=3028667 RepID=UPI0029BC843D|nr:hypothetical protein [Streptomyces sp. MB09-02B]MDX3644417.1 hypothetical protein [Streptomyces sp. MB09-02B]
MREEAGDRQGVEILTRQAADHGDTNTLDHLAEMRDKAGDGEGAKALLRQAADHGSTYALARLAVIQEDAGDREGAEILARQAADQGDTYALSRLAVMPAVFNRLWPDGLDPDGTPTVPWQPSVYVSPSRHVPPGTS